MKDQAIEATVAAVAQKSTVGGAALSLYGGMTAHGIATFIGAAVAVLGLLVQCYYTRKDDRRKTELHQWRLTGAKFPDDQDEG